MLDLRDFDRIDTNPDNAGGPYYGHDNPDGTTDWYSADGTLDCSTETPSDYDEDPYQRRIEEFEKL